MALSHEEIELNDPNTPRKRRRQLRARRFLRFGLSTLLAFSATCLLVLVVAMIYFGAIEMILSLPE